MPNKRLFFKEKLFKNREVIDFSAWGKDK